MRGILMGSAGGLGAVILVAGGVGGGGEELVVVLGVVRSFMV